jgi:hypothetical protein
VTPIDSEALATVIGGGVLPPGSSIEGEDHIGTLESLMYPTRSLRDLRLSKFIRYPVDVSQQ